MSITFSYCFKLSLVIIMQQNRVTAAGYLGYSVLLSAYQPFTV